MTNKVRRSSKASEEELVIACEEKTCERKFITFMGMRTHLKRVHNISYKGRKIPLNLTVCLNCKKDFKSNKNLAAHGSPEVCKKRFDVGWETLQCQLADCGITYKKYVGKNANRKGRMYCSKTCATKANSLKMRIAREKFIASGGYTNTCSRCKDSFQTLDKDKRYCSRKCSYAGNGGLRDGGGHSKQFKYTNRFSEKMSLNKDEIRVAKILDSLPIKWNRNTKGFSYKTEANKDRKFYPDFYIEDIDLYVEYKGWVTDEMTHKMSDAELRNNDLKLLIVVGESPRFAHHGLSILALQAHIDELLKKS